MGVLLWQHDLFTQCIYDLKWCYPTMTVHNNNACDVILFIELSYLSNTNKVFCKCSIFAMKLVMIFYMHQNAR